jgi:hypothetical protein
VFGLGTLASLSLSLKESGVLAGLFLAQLVASGVLREALHRSAAADAELLAFSVLYVVLGLGALGLARRHIVAAVRGTTS